MNQDEKLNRDTLLKILDLARWAPSGDNTQPWRFKIVSDCEVLVIGSDTQSWCVYDLNGWASQMAHGALLETIRIAASGFSVLATWQLLSISPRGGEYLYKVLFEKTKPVAKDPLYPFIKQRTVQRRIMSTQPLTESVRATLVEAVGKEFEIKFFSDFGDRLAIARLLWLSAHIRLTCPEAYRVHREIIEWGAKYSRDRIPELAVGVDHMTARLMRWVLQDWRRVEFFNKYLLGTVLPRIQLDFLPALFCASHVLLLPRGQLIGWSDYVNLGRTMQRLWLTATGLGLHLQPQMTPVIFRWYARMGRSLSAKTILNQNALSVAERLESLAEVSPNSPAGFFCRVGKSSIPSSRSLRKELAELLIE